MPDRICIESLELPPGSACPMMNVAHPQRPIASLILEPVCDLRALDDRLENTVDYFVLAECVKSLAAERPRRLLETLAGEIADTLLARFPLRSVELELRKFILPDTAYVAVQIQRARPA